MEFWQSFGPDSAGRLTMTTTGTPVDPRAPYDLSHLCDGRRTDFPLGSLVETVKVMLNGVYLEEDLDFLLRRKNGQSKIELRRPPSPGDTLLVLRVPSSDAPRIERAPELDDVPAYDQLPKAVKDNLKNGLIAEYVVGERASAPLLPVHALHRV
jgi:hypothetical protein